MLLFITTIFTLNQGHFRISINQRTINYCCGTQLATHIMCMYSFITWSSIIVYWWKPFRKSITMRYISYKMYFWMCPNQSLAVSHFPATDLAEADNDKVPRSFPTRLQIKWTCSKCNLVTTPNQAKHQLKHTLSRFLKWHHQPTKINRQTNWSQYYQKHIYQYTCTQDYIIFQQRPA